MTGARAILEADGLGKSFRGRTVVSSAGFAVHRGQVTALMGRNGAGKTTLLRIAVGRVRPEWGRVLYKGAYVPRPVLWRLARDGLMYVAQRAALNRLFTVGDHLSAMGRAFSGEERMAAAVDELSLGEVLGRRPGALSGGERQRASLAMAMVRAPECLLMDEPFAGVAPLDRQLIRDAIGGLRSRGVGILVTGHDVVDLLAVSDQVIWVTAGTTHWIGSPDQASAHGQFRREYLGTSQQTVDP